MRAFAWAGALLFGAALVWFAFQYFVTFGRPPAGPFRLAALTWNVALFSIFALHHSAFARIPVRRWIQQRHPQAERSIYVWIASLLFLVCCTWWMPLPGVAWEVRGAGRWPLTALQLCGIVLTLRGAAIIDVRELAGVAAQRAAGAHGSAAARPAFSTAWPYGLVRHPIYLGWFLLVWPVATMTMTRLVFAIASCAYLIAAIPFEEGTLLKTAPAYAAYRGQVRWRLVPWIY